MRQVDEAELLVVMRFQISRLPASLRNQLASRHAEARRQAEQMLAMHLVRAALGRYEILSNAPLPEGTDLFSRAAYREGGTGVPVIDCD